MSSIILRTIAQNAESIRIKRVILVGCGVATIIASYNVAKNSVMVELILNRTSRSLQTFWRSSMVKLQTWLLNCMSSDIKPDRRKDFRKLQQHQSNVGAGHSHPDAAGGRKQARGMIQEYEVVTASDMYYLSMSEGEMADGKEGSKEYHFAKDMLTNPKINEPKTGQTVALVDVDYYINMSTFVKQNDYLIYTTMPTTVGGSVENGSYYFKENSVYVSDVNGGAHYEHQLWNYNTDVLFVWKWYGGELFNVEFRRLNHHRALVFLNHRRTVYGPLAWIAFSEHSLRHISVDNGYGMNHLRVLRQDGVLEHHFAPIGVAIDTCITEMTFNNLKVRVQSSKSPQLSDVERILKNEPERDNALKDAAIMFKYFCTLGGLNPTLVSQGSLDNYQTLYPLITEDGKPTARRIAKPMLDEAVAPVNSYNNDVACVEGRLKRVKNQVTTYPAFYYKVMQEFVNLLVPNPGVLVPMSSDQMEAKLTRPTQRALVERFRNGMFYCLRVTISAFMKKECYAKVTDPRNISTLPMNHNFRLGQFMYVLSDHVFKPVHWYAFGTHPRELGQKLVRMATHADYLSSSDISKMDGSMGKIYSDLDLAIARRAFAREYVGELEELIEKERHVRGFTSNGVEYSTDETTLSGSSRTSIKNSAANGYTMYLARRLRGETKEFAWANLGCYGGDDGITPNLPPDEINRTFAKLGLLAKSEKSIAGQPVVFLGRIYVDLWINDHSFSDVVRQIRKLHLTVAPEIVGDLVIFRRKAEGHRSTDGNTPILTVWSDRILEFTKDIAISERDKALSANDVSYWSKFDSPFEPLTDAERQIATSVIAEQLKVQAGKIVDVEAAMRTARNIDELFAVATFTPEMKVEIDAVHRGVVVQGGKRPDHQVEVKKNWSKKTDLPKPQLRTNKRSLPQPRNNERKPRAKPRASQRNQTQLRQNGPAPPVRPRTLNV